VDKRNGDSWQSRRFRSKESVKQSMSYISEGSQRVKSASELESAARIEREALLHGLREAISRDRKHAAPQARKNGLNGKTFPIC
jgi:hypothetical protein